MPNLPCFSRTKITSKHTNIPLRGTSLSACPWLCVCISIHAFSFLENICITVCKQTKGHCDYSKTSQMSFTCARMALDQYQHTQHCSWEGTALAQPFLALLLQLSWLYMKVTELNSCTSFDILANYHYFLGDLRSHGFQQKSQEYFTSLLKQPKSTGEEFGSHLKSKQCIPMAKVSPQSMQTTPSDFGVCFLFACWLHTNPLISTPPLKSCPFKHVRKSESTERFFLFRSFSGNPKRGKKETNVLAQRLGIFQLGLLWLPPICTRTIVGPRLALWQTHMQLAERGKRYNCVSPGKVVIRRVLSGWWLHKSWLNGLYLR